MHVKQSSSVVPIGAQLHSTAVCGRLKNRTAAAIVIGVLQQRSIYPHGEAWLVFVVGEGNVRVLVAACLPEARAVTWVASDPPLMPTHLTVAPVRTVAVRRAQRARAFLHCVDSLAQQQQHHHHRPCNQQGSCRRQGD